MIPKRRIFSSLLPHDLSKWGRAFSTQTSSIALDSLSTEKLLELYIHESTLPTKKKSHSPAQQTLLYLQELETRLTTMTIPNLVKFGDHLLKKKKKSESEPNTTKGWTLAEETSCMQKTSKIFFARLEETVQERFTSKGVYLMCELDRDVGPQKLRTLRQIFKESIKNFSHQELLQSPSAFHALKINDEKTFAAVVELILLRLGDSLISPGDVASFIKKSFQLHFTPSQSADATNSSTDTNNINFSGASLFFLRILDSFLTQSPRDWEKLMHALYYVSETHQKMTRHELRTFATSFATVIFPQILEQLKKKKTTRQEAVRTLYYLSQSLYNLSSPLLSSPSRNDEWVKNALSILEKTIRSTELEGEQSLPLSLLSLSSVSRLSYLQYLSNEETTRLLDDLHQIFQKKHLIFEEIETKIDEKSLMQIANAVSTLYHVSSPYINFYCELIRARLQFYDVSFRTLEFLTTKLIKIFSHQGFSQPMAALLSTLLHQMTTVISNQTTLSRGPSDDQKTLPLELLSENQAITPQSVAKTFLVTCQLVGELPFGSPIRSQCMHHILVLLDRLEPCLPHLGRRNITQSVLDLIPNSHSHLKQKILSQYV